MDFSSKIKTIRESELFDEEFYLKSYGEFLEKTGLSPIEHFLIIGNKLDFNPSADFNTKSYKEKYSDLLKDSDNPLLHYISRIQESSSNIVIEADVSKNSTNSASTRVKVEGTEENEYRDIDLVLSNNAFDENFYTTTYAEDLENSILTPLEHYLSIGWKRGFDPSPDFSTTNYIDRYQDVSRARVNPLVHYLKYGKIEGRKPQKRTLKEEDYFKNHIENKYYYTDLGDCLSLIHRFSSLSNVKYQSPVCVILPVYKNLGLVEKCVESILRNSSLPIKLIIVDDASGEKDLEQYLLSVSERYKYIKLIRNIENKGFVKSVNSALPFVDGHFAIVNSDVEVPYKWLERLLFPIYANPQIASTTPFTNAGTICSFPETLVDNPLYEDFTLEEIDRKFQIFGNARVVEVPTGVGFCMGFSKKVVDKIGFFDEKTFHRGYGEENDWCMKAHAAGFRNVMVPNLFVYHKHGGSFTPEEKQKLLDQNIPKLQDKHPSYDTLVRNFINEDSLNPSRLLIHALLISDLEKDLTLVVDHSFGGGANLYCVEKLEELKKQGRAVLLLTYDAKKNIFLRLDYKKQSLKFTSRSIDQVKTFLNALRIKEIFLNNIFLYEDPFDIVRYLGDMKKQKPELRLVVPVHDFFPVCPSINLLTKNNEYCGASVDIDKCNTCLKELNPFNISAFLDSPVRKDLDYNIENWRGLWGTLLENADEVLCFSENSKEIMLKVFNEKIEGKVNVVPHRVKYLEEMDLGRPLNICIIGNIDARKGREIIEDMLRIIEENDFNINIFVIGALDAKIVSKHFHYLGKYRRESLKRKLSILSVDMFFIPSVWPETFSYTTEELIQLDKKVACFDLGAPAERLKKYSKGTIIPEVSAESALIHIIEAARGKIKGLSPLPIVDS